MAQRSLFADSFIDGPSGTTVQISCTLEDEYYEDAARITLTVLGTVWRETEDHPPEAFKIGVRADMRNPIAFASFTSALLPYGSCVAMKVVQYLMEAANDGYENTKLKGKHGWRSSGEVAAAVAGDIVNQAPKLRGKVLGAFVGCIPFTAVIAALT